MYDNLHPCKAFDGKSTHEGFQRSTPTYLLIQ